MAEIETPARGGSAGRSRTLEGLVAPVAFVVFAVLWAAFGIALVASQGSLDAAWQWIGSLPLIVQLIIWVLFLPVVAGLWVWHTDWSVAIRLVAVAGLAVATVYMFWPKGFLGLKG